VVVLIAVPPLLLGSVHPTAIAALGVVTAVAALVAMVTAWRAGGSAFANALTVAAAFAALMAAVQLVPLPAGMLEVLAPRAHEARQTMHALLPEVSHAGPITLSPADTTLAAGRWCVLALASLAMGTLARRNGQRSRRLVSTASVALVVGGLTQALIGLLHLLIDTKGKVLGVIPTTLNHLHLGTGTFVNPNHAGAFGAMATAAALGLAFGSGGKARWGWSGAAALLASHVLLVASRGALLALGITVVTLVVHAALLRPVRGDGGGTRGVARLAAMAPWAAFALAPLGLVALLTSWFSLENQWFQELGRSQSLEALGQETKVAVTRGALAMLGEVWPMGVGADAFGHVGLAFEGRMLGQRHSFVESDPIELLVTFGVPIGLVLLGLAAIAFAQILRRRPLEDNASVRGERRRLGLVYAVVAFGASAAASFNVEILGLAMVALIAAEVALRGQRQARMFAMPAVLGLGATVLLGGLAVTAAVQWPALDADQRAVEVARSERQPTPLSTHQVLAAGQRTLERIPDDAYELGKVALLLQRAARADADPAAMTRAFEVATRAAERGPHSPIAHIARARAAAALGRPEVAAESYAAAIETTDVASPALLREVFSTLPSPELRARTLPPRKADLRRAVTMLYDAGDPRAAFDLAVELQDRYPEHLEANLLAARMATANGLPDLAELYGRAMMDVAPDNPGSWEITLDALTAQKRWADGHDLLDDALTHIPDATALRLRRASLCVHHPTASPRCATTADDDLQRLHLETIRDDVLRARYFYVSALRWEQRGNVTRARQDAARAVRLQPDDDAYRQKLKQLGAP